MIQNQNQIMILILKSKSCPSLHPTITKSGNKGSTVVTDLDHGRTGLNVMHLCTCLSCKPRPLHVRACWYDNLSQS